MSDIERFFTIWGVVMMPASSGTWVRYDDHRAEVERLKEQVAALTLAVEQADEAKADAEAAAAMEEAETDRVVADGNRALADVERLTVELHETREKLTRVQAQYDELAKITPKLIDSMTSQLRATADRVTGERDEAQVEVERLKNAIDHLTSERDEARGDVERLTAERDEARGEVERLTRMTVADFALAEYRKRWPR